jgi:hypothetical protein
MKKKVLISIVVIIIIVIIGLFICFINNSKTYREDNPNNEILASIIKSNYAWGVTFSGSAIFNDGTIYSWNFDGSNMNEFKEYVGNNNIDTQDGLKNFVLNKASKQSKKVSNEDLEKIEKNINNLTDKDTKFDVNCHGADRGDTSIYVYKNNEQLRLSRRGDCDGQTNSSSGSKILSIINKYH